MKLGQSMAVLRDGADRPMVVVFSVLVLLVLAGAIAFPENISVEYYLVQLQVASFLGIVAVGAMFVILLGEIDLSVPWVMTVAAMVASGLHSAFHGELLGYLSMPVALAFGILCGLWNGLGVAILRAPSMVWTLGLNALLLGLSVFYAGGYNPQTDASPVMRFLAVERIDGVFPVSALVWGAVLAFAAFVLHRTTVGAWIYGRGRSERVLYQAGIRTKTVTILAFAFAGFCTALAGVLFAGRAGQAYQAMGDPFLLPTIAAVVLGGTRIQGGEGRLIGTVAGVLILTILSSLLSVFQAPEALRQVLYGCVIVGMLLVGAESADKTET